MHWGGGLMGVKIPEKLDYSQLGATVSGGQELKVALNVHFSRKVDRWLAYLANDAKAVAPQLPARPNPENDNNIEPPLPNVVQLQTLATRILVITVHSHFAQPPPIMHTYLVILLARSVPTAYDCSVTQQAVVGNPSSD